MQTEATTTESTSITGVIVETSVYDIKAYHGKCECGHLTRYYDREKQAVESMKRHHKKHKEITS